jgi:hypothetical protein
LPTAAVSQLLIENGATPTVKNSVTPTNGITHYLVSEEEWIRKGQKTKRALEHNATVKGGSGKPVWIVSMAWLDEVREMTSLHVDKPRFCLTCWECLQCLARGEKVDERDYDYELGTKVKLEPECPSDDADTSWETMVTESEEEDDLQLSYKVLTFLKRGSVGQPFLAEHFFPGEHKAKCPW